MIRAVYLLLAIVLGACPAAAQTGKPANVLLGCRSATGEDFLIELFRPTQFGPLHCVDGLMIVDMTPCAPDAGWGLSYPTGRASLREVTQMWAIAHRHGGGKFSATLGPDKFVATASFGEGLEADFSKGSYDMTLELDRTTGDGAYTSGALGRVAFHCEIRSRKF
ncbi:hypothetical protein ACTTAL_10480 [Rhodobacter capsulatus]|uniref:hypothetical protein n=1 Tax=Rhodobacter capsulatus TaxID=1061 RepID=UPI0003D3004E|nr:hypothetical protein [Rhodobacter capsulatus]ETD90667.1 hypothetical protein U713_04775 [Rhodobacter capsulatus YW2]